MIQSITREERNKQSITQTISDETRGKGMRRRMSPALPCGANEAMDIYINLVRDEVFKPYPNRINPTEKDRRNPKYCQIHKTVNHLTKECYTLRRFIDTQIKKGTLQIDNIAQNINIHMFPTHHYYYFKSTTYHSIQ